MTEENERKKEYLMSFGRAAAEMKRCEIRIKEIRISKMCPCVKIDDMPHASSHSDLSSYAVLLSQAEEKYMQARYRRMKTYKDVTTKIYQLSNDDEINVLMCRYIRLMSFSKISDKICKSYRHTLRIHGRALDNLDIDKVAINQ